MQHETCAAANDINVAENLDLVGSEMRKPRRARGKGKRSGAPPPRVLRTANAARYLDLSASTLQMYRSMRPDDPGIQGPAYIKVSHGIVLYEIAALDAWLDARRLATLERNARP